MRFGPHTIVRLRAQTAFDPYSGEPGAPDWNLPPDELSIPGCSVQPGPPKDQLLERRDGVVVEFTAWAPIADVTEQDRIRYAGKVYSIDRTIQVWDFPPMSHAVIPLKDVSG